MTFHWSDGHLDVTKKLNFTQDYQLSVEVAATLDGKPLPAGIAWRGGFGDRAVYKAVAARHRLLQAERQAETLLQYKKLGVPENQSQPLEASRPHGVSPASRTSFSPRHFIPDGTDISLWHWTQDHT